MNTQRFRQRIEQYSKATSRLQQACAQEENEFIRDAVIQRFEFCFELAWKMLKLKLEEEGLEANSPRQVIRQAVSAGILDDGNQWTEMHRMRNETAHTYDETLARTVYRFVCEQGLPMFQTLADKASQWPN